VWAVGATIVVCIAVLFDVRRTGYNVLNVVQPGLEGPSVEAIRQDFPDVALPEGIGHDGQQFYAVAREPMHLDEIAPHLDRPRYRLQRPLFPWAAWALHPGGGGPGLVWAMVAVGVVSLVGGAIATGALAHRLGGDPRWAALFPVLPGSYVALRIGTADHLALALLAAALALLLHDRPALATGAAVLAVLAKESMAIPLLGLLLWRRDRQTMAVVGAPLVAAGLWAAWLRLAVDAAERQVLEFTYPFGGIIWIADDWITGDEPWALAAVVASAVLGVWALRRRGAVDPLGGPLLAQLAMMVFLNHNAIGLNVNATRIVSPALLLGALGLIRARSPAPAGA
jgi:hypothetical protein